MGLEEIDFYTFLLLFTSSYVSACQLVDKFNADTGLNIDQHGFHSTLLLGYHISSFNRLPKCIITLKLILPSSVYLELEDKTQEYRQREPFCLKTPRFFNPDILAEFSKSQVGMEIILQKIISECGNKSKFSVVKKAATEALGLGTNALQTLLIDRKLRSSDSDQEKNEKKLPLQLVHTLHDLPFWFNDSNLQCHCFTILIQLISTEDLDVDFDVIRSVIELCISTFTNAFNQTSTEMAARATVIQSLNSFCISRNNGSEKSSKDTAHILSFFCEKLKSITRQVLRVTLRSPQQSPALLLMLDGVQAVLAAQDDFVSDFLADILWQEFIPMLVNILGDPNHISLSNQSSSPNMSPSIENVKGRGITHASSNLVISQSCDISKALYNICGEILRLLGRSASMRSVLEALFHRMLLFPPPEKRLNALKALKNILRAPKVVLSLAFFNKDSGKFDMNLWKIFIECLTECSSLEPSNNLDLIWESTKCLSSFINSLFDFCGENEKDLPTESTVDLDLTLCHAINERFIVQLN
uniref:Uncharacterized protein n=1 Tax=Romanomermis culicivorax TaxID=13658 RepID=A0A915IXF6_ROMCU